MRNILIIGAGSAIARALARQYAEQGCRLHLLARDEPALQRQRQDLMLRGAEAVGIAVLDVNDHARHHSCMETAWQSLEQVDLVLICHGTLPDQPQCEHNFPRIQQELQTNAISTISLLCHIAPRLARQQAGCLAVITSVAGDRGRASNYIYGAAKSMVARYLEGLRAAMLKDGVHVMDIRPGFVDTPMTRQFPKGPLWTRPDTLARSIRRGVQLRRNVLYTPWYWQFIMLVIRAIPEPLFKRLPL